MDLKSIIADFENFLINDLAVEYNPEETREINFEVIFKYDFLETHYPELEDEDSENLNHWFWNNIERLEKKFWNQVEIIKKENEAWEDTKEYLNMTFGIY